MAPGAPCNGLAQLWRLSLDQAGATANQGPVVPWGTAFQITARQRWWSRTIHYSTMHLSSFLSSLALN